MGKCLMPGCIKNQYKRLLNQYIQWANGPLNMI